uniref:Protein phosphatase 2C n=1 Tax=Candidatus Kentrum sp. DK TaxID=2126562 RepID=A0A450SFD0_9GAMM|nr:MAG: Protein phosphatase 2C [Candidatus Kentron sp. DK]
MNWRTVAASVVGTAHTRNGDDCQDSCIAQVETSPDHAPLLFIAVADGAGSAMHGGEGAELAIEASTNFIARMCEQPEFAMNDDLAVRCIISIREIIYARAEEQGVSARDYACTFLGVLSSPQGTLVMQIGDGAVVLDVGEGLHVSIIPMSGEYANMTYFVTDEDAIDILKTKLYPNMAAKVAAFTDGIQRLAVNMKTNTAHEPFFDPLFQVLSSSLPEQEEQLRSALVDFLNKEEIDERTDDDKTLALAVSVE